MPVLRLPCCSACPSRRGRRCQPQIQRVIRPPLHILIPISNSPQTAIHTLPRRTRETFKSVTELCLSCLT
ncbi:hypothetical protein CHARACLAT_012227 [Characodon lateralis]|uniref:Uncharacterized protein n=1 Tax=Characodon lateralis TaxID=208331 RepID=A0ABU7E9G6_9TELE|nr:hypothetical protein [Characodon lateralis]